MRGGGGIWKGDVLIADLEELGNDGRIGNLLEKTQCKRGDISQRKWRFFQSQMDEFKNLGGDQELRTSTLIRDHPTRGESQTDFLGESEGSPPPPPQDSLPGCR